MEKLLEVVRCPFCGGELAPGGREHEWNGAIYSILSCRCGSYPVVAGIPILKRDRIGLTHTAGEVKALIEAGRCEDALLAMLTYPPHPDSLAPSWARALPSIRGAGRLKSLLGRPGIRRWRRETRDLLTRPIAQTSERDFLEWYFLRSGAYSEEHRSGNYDYFMLRVGQPRYLAALSLAKAVHSADGPVLDLACGFGHLTRHLARWSEGQVVLGIDCDFVQIYVAKNFIAPDAYYACAAADVSIPVADRSCVLAFCSDAFHHFFHQANCMRELRRLIREDGVILVATIRNCLVKKDLYKGILPMLGPDGYHALAGDMPHRLVDNRAVMERYLNKLGPQLASQVPASDLEEAQWLSLVASYRADVFEDHPAFVDWPHMEESRVALNAVYVDSGKDASGNTVLRRSFPSSWYEQENASEDGRYVPGSVTVSPEQMRDIMRGLRTARLERLIQQGVVVGLPDNSRSPARSREHAHAPALTQ